MGHSSSLWCQWPWEAEVPPASNQKVHRADGMPWGEPWMEGQYHVSQSSGLAIVMDPRTRAKWGKPGGTRRAGWHLPCSRKKALCQQPGCSGLAWFRVSPRPGQGHAANGCPLCPVSSVASITGLLFENDLPFGSSFWAGVTFRPSGGKTVTAAPASVPPAHPPKQRGFLSQWFLQKAQGRPREPTWVTGTRRGDQGEGISRMPRPGSRASQATPSRLRLHYRRRGSRVRADERMCTVPPP